LRKSGFDAAQVHSGCNESHPKGAVSIKNYCVALTALALLVFIAAGGQPAYSAAPFYEGKSIGVIVGAAP